MVIEDRRKALRDALRHSLSVILEARLVECVKKNKYDEIVKVAELIVDLKEARTVGEIMAIDVDAGFSVIDAITTAVNTAMELGFGKLSENQDKFMVDEFFAFMRYLSQPAKVEGK